MGILDIILGVLLAYGLFRGLKNGFFVEIASVIALIAGIFGAIHFSYIASDYLNELAGCELFFKCENFQEPGAFKHRAWS